MGKPRKAAPLVQRPTDALSVTARAKALETDILTLHYTGSTDTMIAKRFGLEANEVHDCQRVATPEAHRTAYENAAHYPDIARQTLRGFAPRAAEIVKELAEDKKVKPATRLDAATTALDAAGASPKSPGTVNLNFPVLSKDDLKELVGAAVNSGIHAVTAPPTPDEITDIDPEPPEAA